MANDVHEPLRPRCGPARRLLDDARRRQPGFLSLTLNWFDIAAAFGLIAPDLQVGIPQLALLISLFVIGYGLAHIPGGILATRIGMKRTLVAGILLEGLAGVGSGIATNYTALAIFRVIAGVGGSIFIAVVTVWFQGRELSLALGVSGGAAFSIGVAVGLYVWTFVQAAIGWHVALVVGGVIGILIALVTAAVFRTPAGATTLAGVAITRAGLREGLGHRDLWIYGIALLGGYGRTSPRRSSWPSTPSPTRLQPRRGWLLAALIGLAGIPGGIVGGMLADRSRNIRAFVVGPLLIIAVLLALIPFVPAAALWLLGIGIGFFLLFGFAAWSSVPGRVAGIAHEHIGTAIGLMLTLAAVGGFVVPIVFGELVPAVGFSGGWVFLGVVTAVFAAAALAGRGTAVVEASPSGVAPDPVERPA